MRNKAIYFIIRDKKLKTQVAQNYSSNYAAYSEQVALKPKKNKFIHKIIFKKGKKQKKQERIEFKDIIRDIEVNIDYSFKEQEYQATFKKTNDPLNSQNSIMQKKFTSKTWDILEQHIMVELRDNDFARFIGITVKKKMMNSISEKGRELFKNCP